MARQNLIVSSWRDGVGNRQSGWWVLMSLPDVVWRSDRDRFSRHQHNRWVSTAENDLPHCRLRGKIRDNDNHAKYSRPRVLDGNLTIPCNQWSDSNRHQECTLRSQKRITENACLPGKQDIFWGILSPYCRNLYLVLVYGLYSCGRSQREWKGLLPNWSGQKTLLRRRGIHSAPHRYKLQARAEYVDQVVYCADCIT